MTSRFETDGHFVASIEAAFDAATDGPGAGFVMPWKGVLTRVQFVPSAGITANGTNFSTLTLQNKGPNGAGVVAMASRSWAATNSVANTPEDFTLNATQANREFALGDYLLIARTHGGSGLIIPAGTLLLTVLPRI